MACEQVAEPRSTPPPRVARHLPLQGRLGETDCLAMTCKRETCAKHQASSCTQGSAKRSGSARKQRRQPIPRLRPDKRKCPTIAMTSPVTVPRFSALAPFSSGPGADRLLFGKTKRRWGARRLPLPVADQGSFRAPQPRPWRAVAKQAREGQMRQGGSHFAGYVLRTGSRRSSTPPPRVARHLPLQGRLGETDCLAMTCKRESGAQNIRPWLANRERLYLHAKELRRAAEFFAFYSSCFTTSRSTYCGVALTHMNTRPTYSPTRPSISSTKPPTSSSSTVVVVQPWGARCTVK